MIFFARINDKVLVTNFDSGVSDGSGNFASILV